MIPPWLHSTILTRIAKAQLCDAPSPGTLGEVPWLSNTYTQRQSVLTLGAVFRAVCALVIRPDRETHHWAEYV